MATVIAYLCCLLAPAIGVIILLMSYMAEHERIDIYACDKSEIDKKIQKWHEMKRQLNDWKEGEWRKMEERRIARDEAVSKSLKELLGEQ